MPHEPARTERWSPKVTATSDPLDLKQGVFCSTIRARSCARSSGPPSAAASGRATLPVGDVDAQLLCEPVPTSRRAVLDRAKDELRELFNRY